MFHRHDHHDEPQREEVQAAPEPAGEAAEPWAKDGPEFVAPEWAEEPGGGAPQEAAPNWTEEAGPDGS